MVKSELRKTFLEQQKSLDKRERVAKSRRATQHLFESFNFNRWRFVSCFVTFEKNNEFDTSQIFKRIWREFSSVVTVAPRVSFERNALESVRISPETKFVANKWQILEPQSDELVEPYKLDAVLVPLLAFDKRGFRVGYGKGFYDKFLAECRADCLKLGLSLFPPVEKIEDVKDFDVRLDACATPEKVFDFPRR